MRLFGKISNILLNVSRNVNYSGTARRSNVILGGRLNLLQEGVSRCDQLRHLASKSPSNVFSLNTSTDMLRKRISFSGNPGIIKNENDKLLPIGVIKMSDGSKNIILVPLDLMCSDEKMFKFTLNTINTIRRNAVQISEYTDALNKIAFKLGALQDIKNIPAANNAKPTADDYALPSNLVMQDEVSFWKSYNKQAADINAIDNVAANNNGGTAVNMASATTTPNSVAAFERTPMQPAIPTAPTNPPSGPNTSPISPVTQPCTPQQMPTPLPKEEHITAPQINSALGEHEAIQEIFTTMPDGLEKRLNEMAISSMQLAFDIDLTNIRDALEHDKKFNHYSLLSKSMKDNDLRSVTAKIELSGNKDPKHTVPLNFNTQIKGVVQIDISKLAPEVIDKLRIPEFNKTVTSIATNLCSTALRNGSPLDLNHKPYSHTMSLNKIAGCEEPTVCTAAEAKGCISADNKHLPKYDPDKQAEGDETETLVNYGKVALTEEQHTALKNYKAVKRINPCAENYYVVVDEQSMTRDKSTLTARTIGTVTMPDEDESTMDIQLRDGCKNPPVKKKKKCPKTCPLDDPCKEDPCKRPKYKEKHGGKKTKSESVVQPVIASASKKSCNPCGKGKKDGKDEDKKKDPCAKFKKGKEKDPCAKFKKGKDKDPCAKFKKGKEKDPCAKFKKGKEKDPCAKFKKGKEKDPCAKFKKDEKKDPCAKFKKDKGKKDPCAKFKKDKKKDPCAKFKKNKGKEDPCGKKANSCKQNIPKIVEPNFSLQKKMLFKPKPLNSYDNIIVGAPNSNTRLCKCFSTQTLRQISNEFHPTVYDYMVNYNLCSKFPTYSLYARRSYGSKKKSGKNGKCNIKIKYPKNRKAPRKPLKGLRTDCFEQDDCPKKLCKDKCPNTKLIKPKRKCPSGK